MQHLKAMNEKSLWWFYSDLTECLKILCREYFVIFRGGFQMLLWFKVSIRLCSLMSLLAWGMSRSNKLFLFVVLFIHHLESDWNTSKSTGLIATQFSSCTDNSASQTMLPHVSNDSPCFLFHNDMRLTFVFLQCNASKTVTFGEDVHISVMFCLVMCLKNFVTFYPAPSSTQKFNFCFMSQYL